MSAESAATEPAGRVLRLTAVVTREGDWCVARCLEVDAVSQGETVEHALVNLRDVVEVYLEEGEGEPPVSTGFIVLAPLDVRIPM